MTSMTRIRAVFGSGRGSVTVVGMAVRGRLPRRPEEHPFHRPEHVPGAEDDARDGSHRHRQIRSPPLGGDASPGPLERAEEHHELSDESIEARQPDAREGEEEKHECQPRGPRRDPTEIRDRPSVVTLVDHPDQREQPRRRETVVDQLERRPFDGHWLEGRDAHHAVAHVTHRRISDESLEIGLRKRYQRPVEDSHNAQAEDPRGGGGCCLREHRQGEAKEAIDADLEEDAGEIDASPRRCLNVRQREPGVEGNDRHLDGKAGKQGQKHPPLQPSPLGIHRERMGRQAGGERGDVEGERAGVRGVPQDDREQAEERKHAPGEGVDEELHRGPTAVVVPPDADEEKQRHEGELEEHVEQDHVPGREHAEHRRLEDEQQNVEADRLLFDRLPADHHGGHGEEGREAEQPDRQSVEAEREADVERSIDEPRPLADGEGVPGRHLWKCPEDEEDGAGKRDQRRDRGALTHRRDAARSEQPGRQGTDERGEDDQQEVVGRGEGVHGWGCRGGADGFRE